MAAHNASYCYVTNMWRRHLGRRASASTTDRQGLAQRRVAGPSRDGVLRPGDRLPPIRRVAARARCCRPRRSAPPGRCSPASGTDPHRRPAGHDRAPTAAARRRAATGGRWRHGRLRARPVHRGARRRRCCPTSRRRCAALTDGRRRRAATSTTRSLPELRGRCCADVAVSRRRSSPSSTARWTRSTCVAAHCCASATGSWSSSPCFPPLLDLLEAAGVEVVGVPLDAEGLRPRRARRGARRPRPAAVFLQPRGAEPDRRHP